jgi:hypothetical protein
VSDHIATSTARGTITVALESCSLTMPDVTQSVASAPMRIVLSLGEDDSTKGDLGGKQITVTGTEAAMKPVGPFTAVTDASGHATVAAALTEGAYALTASFAGDGFYKACSAAGDVLVTVARAEFKVTGGGWFANSVGRTSFGFNAKSDVAGLRGQIQIRTSSKGNEVVPGLVELEWRSLT